jgi:hypothetical protein
MRITREDLQRRAGNFLEANGLNGNYIPVVTKQGPLDVLTIYSAGTRKSFLGFQYGGEVAARVELITRSERPYENGSINGVESRIEGVAALDLRRAVADAKFDKKPENSTKA